MENSNFEAHFNRFEFTQAFKEKIVLEVYFKGKDIQKAVEEYDLPSVHAVQGWIRQFQKQLDNGAIVLPAMTEEHKQNLQAANLRIKELEKALEYSNTVIFSLNHLLDFAEKEFSIPIRKKGGTKQ
jgi:transposase